VFIGMMRAAGIPARFEIGFSVPAEQREGAIPGYHCWAEFYVEPYGWIPVDASEAWKHPDKKDYFFGAHDYNRLQSTVLTLPASYDAQIEVWDIERYGGSVFSWRLVGTALAAATTYLDNALDSAALAGELLEFDNFEPWPTVDIPWTATVGVNGITSMTVIGVAIVVLGPASAFPVTSPVAKRFAKCDDEFSSVTASDTRRDSSSATGMPFSRASSTKLLARSASFAASAASIFAAMTGLLSRRAELSWMSESAAGSSCAARMAPASRACGHSNAHATAHTVVPTRADPIRARFIPKTRCYRLP